MTMTARHVYYEWGIEYTNQHGDIVDSDFFKTLKEAALAFVTKPPTAHSSHLVLIRDVYGAGGDVTDRQWAYPHARAGMPMYFNGGAKVPQRFRDEYARWTAE